MARLPLGHVLRTAAEGAVDASESKGGGVGEIEVVIGVDAHKCTHTLVATDELGRELGHKTVAGVPPVRWARFR